MAQVKHPVRWTQRAYDIAGWAVFIVGLVSFFILIILLGGN